MPCWRTYIPGISTTQAVVPGKREAKARLVAKEAFVLAGIHVAARVFNILDREAVFTPCFADGDVVDKREYHCRDKRGCFFASAGGKGGLEPSAKDERCRDAYGPVP